MTTVDDLLSANPFPGLRPFSENEGCLFFGRRQQIEELAALVGTQSFIAVAGASGCGKSSLVIAGLLNELARDRGPGAVTWRWAVLRPGNRPIGNLAEKLSPVIGMGGDSDESRTGALVGRLRLGGLGLVEAVKLARLDPLTRVLVVVDQFEEIFRFKKLTDVDEASAFVKLLLNAARDPDSPVTVIITLRSETLGSCADFLDLPQAVSRGQYLVPKLTRDQRKEAITKPVELRNFSMAPRLVQRLLNDVSSSYDDLPVMQHVLTRTWNRWAETAQGERPLDLEDYEAVGAAKEAISNHAEQAYSSLPGLEPVVEKVFRALTEQVSEGIEVRRPLDFDRLCRVVGGNREDVEQVVNCFRRPDTAFLMPPHEIPLATNPVIDISHEALIRQWQRLRDWADAENKSRRMLMRLVDAARLYEQKEGSLWRDRYLDKALQWRENTKPSAEWAALYVPGEGVSTLAATDNFLALSETQARRERWLSKGRLALYLAVVVMAVLLVNDDRTKRAGRHAMNASQELSTDPTASAKEAAAAIQTAPGNERAEQVLRLSLAALDAAHPEKVIDLKEAVADIRLSRDGRRLVAASGKTVTIFETGGFNRIGSLAPQRGGKVLKCWLLAKNEVVAARTASAGSDAVAVQGVSDATALAISCPGEGNGVSSVAASPDDQHVAVGCQNGDVKMVTIQDGRRHPGKVGDGELSVTDILSAPQDEAEGRVVTALAFSADGAFLASGHKGGSVNVMRAGHKGAIIGAGAGHPSPISQEAAITDLSFHPTDPRRLVSASDDTNALVWNLDLDHGRVVGGPAKLEHDRPVTQARFVATVDNRYPVMTVSDKRVKLSGDLTAEWRLMRRNEDRINDADVSGDGAILATASSDGTARLWSTRTGGSLVELLGHKDAVNRTVFAPEIDRIVTASADGTVRIWHYKLPKVVSASRSCAMDAVFDAKEENIAVGEEGGCRVVSVRDLNRKPKRLEGVRGYQYGHLSWSRDGKHLLALQEISRNEPSRPVLWDVETGNRKTPKWLSKCNLAAVNPVTGEVVTASSDGSLGIWNEASLFREDARPVMQIGGAAPFTVVAISADRRWVAASDGDKAYVWNRARVQNPPEIFRHNGRVVSLQFSTDGKRLVTASTDKAARIWDLEPPWGRRMLRAIKAIRNMATGKRDGQGADPAKVLRGGHTARLSSASFDPRDELVVTSSADNTMRFWDAESGRPHATLKWHGEGVNAVHFSRDRRILSASDDGTVKLGDCPAAWEPVGKLRERVATYLESSGKESTARHGWKLWPWSRWPGNGHGSGAVGAGGRGQ